MTTCASVAGSASRCPRTGACSKGSSSSSTELARSGSRPSWRWCGRGFPLTSIRSRGGSGSRLRGVFARYLATVDPASEVPATDLLPGHRPRITPYVYSEQEIAALMEAARQLRPALRAARHETLIGLLAVTGCRPGEALGLDRADVDLDNGVVHVRAGKQKKQRQVPLHQSTVGALRGYAGLRDARLPLPSTPAFFLSARGRRMGREELNATFISLVRQVGLEGRGSRARPRPHDLRH